MGGKASVLFLDLELFELGLFIAIAYPACICPSAPDLPDDAIIDDSPMSPVSCEMIPLITFESSPFQSIYVSEMIASLSWMAHFI